MNNELKNNKKETILFLFCVYTYVSWFVFLSLSLWMSVPVFGYIMTHCMSIYVSGSCLFLSFWISVVVICYIITHCMCLYPSLGPWFSVSLTLSMPIAVFGYIVTDCNSIGTSLDRRILLFFPFLCLSQCMGILSVSLRVYVRPMVHICFSLCKSVYHCPDILSLIVGVYVRLLIRVCLSVSLKVFITCGL